MPVFETDGGVALALARGAADAGAMLAFGAALGAWGLAPAEAGAAARRRLQAWLGASLALAAAASLAWLLLEIRALAGGVSGAALAAVLGGTRFGTLLLARAGLLAAAALAWRARRGGAACWLTAGALATAAGISHAAAMQDGALLGSVLLHLLAGGAWLGGLAPLWIVLRHAPPAASERAARRFSALGYGCVAGLAATAAFQGAVLVGSWRGLAGTDYGWMALAKAAGLAALMALAWRNRFRLMPAMGAASARARLRRAVLAELAIGFAVVLAAGLLAQMAPAADRVAVGAPPPPMKM